MYSCTPRRHLPLALHDAGARPLIEIRHQLVIARTRPLTYIHAHTGPGGKTGTYGVASAQQEAIDRRERLRKLALETIDIAKDPYFMRNHLGQYECKLCLTIHPNEGNYLAHTQGKRHQDNLRLRAAKEAKERAASLVLPQPASVTTAPGRKRVIRIGRPGYRIAKQFDPATGARSLLFEVEYPEIEEGLQPRHRFMSAYEQRVEAPDKNWQCVDGGCFHGSRATAALVQTTTAPAPHTLSPVLRLARYLLFAADQYETIAFKVPALEVDRDPSKFFTSWDDARKLFTLQLHFRAARGDAPHGNGGGATVPSTVFGAKR